MHMHTHTYTHTGLLFLCVCLMSLSPVFRVTGGELFEDIVAREYYSEADAR